MERINPRSLRPSRTVKWSMGLTAQTEILDLRHFSAAQLRPLLRDQAIRWERRLHWDYQASSELLLEYIDARVLPGFVALERGRILGYTFCVTEAVKAVIGDVYALGEGEKLDNPVCENLLKHLLEMVKATPGVERIELQLLMFPAGALHAPLLPQGFQASPRLFMEWDFAQAKPASPSSADFPANLRLLPWMPAFYEAAAELIHYAYQGHVDSGINDQYLSIGGSQRFLHNVIRFPGCGIFEAENSWVLRDEGAGRLVGLLLSSRIRRDVGHITQICVAPELRGAGLGQALLLQCATELVRRGGTAISLTVTEGNLAARRLYDKLGFRTLQRFDAMVWNSSR